MMPCRYKALDGSIREVDLDAVFDIALGASAHRPGWSATIIYDPASGSFVELRDSPPDYRGNSADEAEEVSEKYVSDTFKLDAVQLEKARRTPSQWIVVNRRPREES